MSKKKRRGVWGWNVHPGEILQEEFLKPLGISVYELAKQVHLTRSRVNDIVRKRRDYRRYRLAFGQVFWHHRGILDEPASYL